MTESKYGMFKPASNKQAYAKVGTFGEQGSGKTLTSAYLAKLIWEMTGKKLPVFMLDTESGSDFVEKLFKEWGIPLYVDKTRAFVRLMEGLKTAEKERGILIIDSVTHFWAEIQRAYKTEKRIDRVEFHHWGQIKDRWGEFPTAFLNAQAHIIMCGRSGFEYENYVDEEDGKRKIAKTGTKMKVEGEMGYEPALLIEMVQERRAPEKENKVKGLLWDNVAYVLKDRSRTLNGKSFRNPTGVEFKPFLEYLNLGGAHEGVDTAATSGALFAKDSDLNVHQRKKEVVIAKEEIEGVLTAAFPGRSADEVKAKTELLHEAFGSYSWTQLDEVAPETLRDGLEKLKDLIEVRKKSTKKEPAKSR